MQESEIPQEVVTALIALGGVVLSVVASAYLSLRQTNVEMRKLRSETVQAYADRLLDERLKVYPSLYSILSSFSKRVWKEPISREALSKLHEAINNWNSEHGILLSGRTNIVAYRFYKMTSGLVERTEDEIRELFLLNQEKANLVRKISELELALKSDIGIYIAENSYDDDDFRSYQQLADAVEKRWAAKSSRR